MKIIRQKTWLCIAVGIRMPLCGCGYGSAVHPLGRWLVYGAYAPRQT